MADLCSLDDVVGYMPGYDQADTANSETNATLEALIAAQTVEIIERTGREYVAITPTLDPRTFDVTCGTVASRRLPIGDATTITQIVQKRSGSTVQTFNVAGPDVVLRPRVRQAWQPYTELWFPLYTGSSPALLVEEDSFVITATWGYPSVPAEIKQACAKLVVVRYLTDVAGAATAFADAATGDINIGGLFASGEAVVRRNQIP